MKNNETMVTGVNQSKKTLQMALIAVMAAMICVVAPFSIPLPFTLVPISFTNLMIYIAVFALGWKRGTLSYVLYLLIGFVGVPVFSGFTGGPAKFVGPTGGYLIGFVFTAIVTGLFIDFASEKELSTKGKTNLFRIVFYVTGMLIGAVIFYAFGTIWYMLQQNIPFEIASIGSVLAACVVPFLPGDVMKIVIAVIVGIPLRTTLRKNQLV